MARTIPATTNARMPTFSGILPLSSLRNIAPYIGQQFAMPKPAKNISTTMPFLIIPTVNAHRLSIAAAHNMTKKGESTPKLK